MSTLPALSKVWSCRSNAPFLANDSSINLFRSHVINLIKHLRDDTSMGGTVGGTRDANSVWTCLGSCDGAGAFGLDSVDRIVDLTDMVFAVKGSNHTWWVGQNTTLGYQICIDCNHAATNLAVVATEIGVPFSGGSATERPASANEFILGTTSIPTTSLNYTVHTDVVTGQTNYTHFVTRENGAFWFFVSRLGLGAFSAVYGLQKTDNAAITDTRNIILIGQAVNVGSYPRGAMDYQAEGIAARVANRCSNGTYNTSGGMSQPQAFGSATMLGTTTLDGCSGKYNTWPVDIASMTNNELRGRIPDMYSITKATVGASIPSIAAQEYIVAGDHVFPFPSIVPSI
jgi:hypothetical protein